MEKIKTQAGNLKDVEEKKELTDRQIEELIKMGVLPYDNN